jgi:hypothetical protein
MGAIRWTGKGLQLLGGILCAEGVEAWLRDKGQSFLEDRARSIGWWFPRRRARWRILAEVTSNVLTSETFCRRLQAELESLPMDIGRIASRLTEIGPKELVRDASLDWLAVVPRYLVQKLYENKIMTALLDSNELSRFPELPEVFLKRAARISEDSFFHHAHQTPAPCGDSRHSFILGTDSKYGWDFDGIDGHYYCWWSFNSHDFTRRSEVMDVLSRAQPILEETKQWLGGLSHQEVSQIKAKMGK